jgi:hypothetical protein
VCTSECRHVKSVDMGSCELGEGLGDLQGMACSCNGDAVHDADAADITTLMIDS